jgi:hypothetical protein
MAYMSQVFSNTRPEEAIALISEFNMGLDIHESCLFYMTYIYTRVMSLPEEAIAFIISEFNAVALKGLGFRV